MAAQERPHGRRRPGQRRPGRRAAPGRGAGSTGWPWARGRAAGAPAGGRGWPGCAPPPRAATAGGGCLRARDRLCSTASSSGGRPGQAPAPLLDPAHRPAQLPRQPRPRPAGVLAQGDPQGGPVGVPLLFHRRPLPAPGPPTGVARTGSVVRPGRTVTMWPIRGGCRCPRTVQVRRYPALPRWEPHPGRRSLHEAPAWGDGDPVENRVEASVAAPIKAVADPPRAGGLQRGHAGIGRQLRVGGKAPAAAEDAGQRPGGEQADGAQAGQGDEEGDLP